MPKQVMRRPPFVAWLKHQAQRDDPVGDLAKDALSDSGFNARAHSLETAVMYLRHKSYDTRPAILALENAWAEFEQARAR